MKLNKKILKISRWDFYSVVIFIVAVLFQVLKWRLLPIFIDIYYHLLTARGFHEAGGWIYHCFWEYAPIGRPQLYPPLLHIILLFLIKLGIPVIVIGKLIQFIMYPLILFTIWFVVRGLFDRRQAFLALILIFSVYPFYLTTVNASAASLSFILCFFSLFFFEKNKIIPSLLLLSLGMYAHGYTSWIFVGYFLVYAVLHRERLRYCLMVIGSAVCIASPLIIFQLKHIDYFHFQRNIIENYFIELNIVHWVLFLFGIVVCLKERKRYRIFIALFCSSAFLLLSGAFFRYASFYGVLSVVLVNVAFLDYWYSRFNARQKKIFGGIFLILFVVFSPTLTIALSKQHPLSHLDPSMGGVGRRCLNSECSVQVNFLNSSFVNFMSYGMHNKIRTDDVTVYNKKHFTQLTDIIKNRTDTDDILYSNAEFPYLTGMLALLSHRATATAMLSEIKPYQAFDAIKVSRLIIWQKDPNNMKREPVFLIRKYGLRKIADTALAFVYENPSCRAKKKIIPATIGYKTLFLMLFLVCVAIGGSAKSRCKI